MSNVNPLVPEIPIKSVIAPVAFFVLVLVGLSTLLIAWRVESVVSELTTAREWLQISQLKDEIEGGFHVGLSVYDMKNLNASLKRAHGQEKDLIGSMVVDDQDAVIAGNNEGAVKARLNPVWRDHLLGRKGSTLERSSHLIGKEMLIGLNVVDPSGRISAVVWMLYSHAAVRNVSGKTLSALLVPVAIASVALLLIGVIGMLWLVKKSELRMGRWIDAVGNASADTKVDELMLEQNL